MGDGGDGVGTVWAWGGDSRDGVKGIKGNEEGGCLQGTSWATDTTTRPLAVLGEESSSAR